MTRYVDVEKLTHRIMDADYINTACEMLIEIECMPEEEVAPVIHAHWYHKPHVWGVDYCSNCDFELHINDTKYCPSCGAIMDEVIEE